MARKFFYVCAGLFLLAGAYAIGSRSAAASASSNQEIAVGTGHLVDGQTIPLPHYSDGSRAVESDCRWVVTPREFSTDANPRVHRYSAENRVVVAYGCIPGPLTCVPSDPTFGHAEVNYMIIAVRNLTPTSHRSETIGGIKSQYR